MRNRRRHHLAHTSQQRILMKKAVLVIAVTSLTITACSSTSREERLRHLVDQAFADYKVDLVNSCSYQGKGERLENYRHLFDNDDVKKSEYETRNQYIERLKAKVPEYLTFRAKAGYMQYNAETGIMRVSVTSYGAPQGLQMIDLADQKRKETANLMTSFTRNPRGRSFPRVSLGSEVPYSAQLMGETAWGYQKEYTAARYDEYYASLGMLDSIKSSVDQINYYAEISMTGNEAKSVKDSLEIEFTIRTVAPYLLSVRKDASTPTISDPYAIAIFQNTFVGDYCTSSFIDSKTGKQYNVPLKVDLPKPDYSIIR